MESIHTTGSQKEAKINLKKTLTPWKLSYLAICAILRMFVGVFCTWQGDDFPHTQQSKIFLAGDKKFSSSSESKVINETNNFVHNLPETGVRESKQIFCSRNFFLQNFCDDVKWVIWMIWVGQLSSYYHLYSPIGKLRRPHHSHFWLAPHTLPRFNILKGS